MKKIQTALALAVLLLPAGSVLSQDDSEAPLHTVYDRERGELSPGTQAPSRERMVNAIKSASPTALYSMLEYGERVECYECIPLLEKKLLDSDDAEVREIAAWWLRRRSFGFGRAMVSMKAAIAEDSDPVRRSRAAEALGEFLDPHGLPALVEAVRGDSEPMVRASAVRALGRLNAVAGNAGIAEAMGDRDASVREEALKAVLKVNFFDDQEAVLARLDDDDSQVRLRAAQLAGELRIAEAADALAGLLRTDEHAGVRQAAAFALGRMGGSTARDALNEAKDGEESSAVLDAVEVALKMGR